MSGHEAKSWSVWCQGEDIEKVREDQGRIETKNLLRQVTTLVKQARRFKETKA